MKSGGFMNVRTLMVGIAIGALTLTGCGQPQLETADGGVQTRGTLVTHKEAETMTSGGGCTGFSTTSVFYYCNNDSTFNSFSFAQTGTFTVTVRGASSNNTAAGISVYVAGSRVATFSFTGTTLTNKSQTFNLPSTGSKEIRLKLETDNGSNDTVIDWYEITFEGATTTTTAPVGKMSEMFATLESIGVYGSAVANNKTYNWVQYNNNGVLDIRTEGMGYAMVLAVTQSDRTRFDRLYLFLKDFMQYTSGNLKNFFKWRCLSSNWNSCDGGIAPDGETYIVQGLYMAAKKWGGTYYSGEANTIATSMFDASAGHLALFATNNLIKFSNGNMNSCGGGTISAEAFTDPSYVNPAFYQYWKDNASSQSLKNNLTNAITAARSYLQKAVTSKGLSPDYSAFDGSNSIAVGGACRGKQYGYDAWRTAMHWSLDYKRNGFSQGSTMSINLQNTMLGYATGNWDISKIPSVINTDNTNPSNAATRAGHIGMLAMSTLANSNPNLLAAFNKLDPKAGALNTGNNSAYYDGLLYYLALAHLTNVFAW
jgi:endo-1,4-beta-D-glucanase Y